MCTTICCTEEDIQKRRSARLSIVAALIMGSSTITGGVALGLELFEKDLLDVGMGAGFLKLMLARRLLEVSLVSSGRGCLMENRSDWGRMVRTRRYLEVGFVLTVSNAVLD